ncbi:unnamed protein product [Microthlaspi erraticum]|uniref:Arabidopsis retrotransposon Orf1 C-terminal domain-containing protein n=1 Tax=Microthlaspi erraticum TaxID=1685480 RepID=A0A6D2K4W1_9BRAS|nr:unnamed protein product [Microthlaspi erraticum]
MYQEHYNALFSMDFMETKYPHVDTMKALGIFEDVELVSRTCTWPSFLSHGILQGAHLRVFASMRYHMYDEEDRADLDQGLGWITFLAKGEKRMVTFRQLGNLVWVQLWRGYQVELQGKGTPKVWATIADGVYSSSRSKAAQIRSPVLGVLMSFGAFWSIWDMRSMEGLGTWKQLNWIRKGRREKPS